MLSLLDIGKRIDENKQALASLRQRLEQKTAEIERKYNTVVEKIDALERTPDTDELREEFERMHQEEMAELHAIRREVFALMGVHIPKPNKGEEAAAWAIAAEIMLDKGPLTIAQLEKEFEERGYEHRGQDLKATIRTTVNSYTFFRKIGEKGDPSNPLKYDLIPEELPGPGESAGSKAVTARK